MNRNVIVAGLIAAVCVPSAFAAKDRFNRADLGSKWVVTSGSLYISSNQLTGDNLSLGYLKTSKSDEKASVVASLGGTDTEYAAIALGEIAAGNNAFIKVQSQNAAGTFDSAGFYVGNNDSGGGSFFTLDTPAASPAIVTVSMSGSVATLTIKSDFGSQSYQYDYGGSFGSGAGLGTYGAVSLDNFKSASTVEAVVQPRVVTKSNAVDRSH